MLCLPSTSLLQVRVGVVAVMVAVVEEDPTEVVVAKEVGAKKKKVELDPHQNNGNPTRTCLVWIHLEAHPRGTNLSPTEFSILMGVVDRNFLPVE